MKRAVFTIISVISALLTVAQESQTAYNFLRLPVSAHVAALGGDNISIVEDDATLIFHNPALINDVSDRTINLNFMWFAGQGAWIYEWFYCLLLLALNRC